MLIYRINILMPIKNIKRNVWSSGTDFMSQKRMEFQKKFMERSMKMTSKQLHSVCYSRNISTFYQKQTVECRRHAGTARENEF